MYRIGEFSYLCSMSIKTLRYYDKIGVLIPASVDELTGYRYYSIDQLEQAQKIKNHMAYNSKNAAYIMC